MPAVFPYFILTTFLTNLSALTLTCKKLTPISKCLFNTGGITLYPFLISLFSGYPIGAKTVADLKEKGVINDIEGVRASVFSSFASPMFVIGSIGSIMLNNLRFGFIILLNIDLFSLNVLRKQKRLYLIKNQKKLFLHLWFH